MGKQARRESAGAMSVLIVAAAHRCMQRLSHGWLQPVGCLPTASLKSLARACSWVTHMSACMHLWVVITHTWYP